MSPEFHDLNMLWRFADLPFAEHGERDARCSQFLGQPEDVFFHAADQSIILDDLDYFHLGVAKVLLLIPVTCVNKATDEFACRQRSNEDSLKMAILRMQSPPGITQATPATFPPNLVY